MCFCSRPVAAGFVFSFFHNRHVLEYNIVSVGEKYITQHASLAGTLAVQGTQASWTSPFHRLKSAQANKRVKLQVNVMNQQKDRRKDPGLEKYANLPGMQTNFAQGSNNDSFIPVAEALHLLNQEHLKA